MSVQAIHDDASSMTSRQVSFDEVLEDFACPELVETESIERERALDEIARRDDLKDPDEIDYSQEVAVVDDGDCFHLIRYGLICTCLGGQGTTVPLWQAVLDGHRNCERCGSIDVRTRSATEEGSS